MRSSSTRQHKIDRVIAATQDHHSELKLARPDRRFLIWATELYLASFDTQPSIEELLGNITDGKDDLEIDAYHVDEDAKIVYLFQSKFRSAPGNLSKKDIADFQIAPLRLCSTNLLAGNTNDKILELAPTFRQYMADGYEVQLVLVTTLNLTTGLANEANSWATQELRLPIGGEQLPIVHTLTICDIDDLLTRYDTPLETASVDVDLQLKPGEWHISTASKFKCLIATIDGQHLAETFHKYRYAMFRQNPRGPLGTGGVNKEIATTLGDDSEKELFLLLNNGLSGVCDGFTTPVADSGNPSTYVTDFQIVNGCQTTFTLWNHWRRGQSLAGVSLSLKVVEGLPYTTKISHASNSQSPMKDWDFLFNDDVQVRVQKEFQQLTTPVFYELRRGEYRYIAKDKSRRIPIKDIAQTAYAFLGFPGEAKDKVRDIPRSKSNAQGIYGKIFFPDVTARYLYLPQLVYEHVHDRHTAYVEETGHSGDFREYGRLHLVWLIGRALTFQLMQRTEQWAYADIKQTLLRGVIDKIGEWFDPAHEVAITAIENVTEIERRVAEERGRDLSLRQLYRSAERYGQFAKEHDKQLAKVGKLPFGV